MRVERARFSLEIYFYFFSFSFFSALVLSLLSIFFSFLCVLVSVETEVNLGTIPSFDFSLLVFIFESVIYEGNSKLDGFQLKLKAFRKGNSYPTLPWL